MYCGHCGNSIPNEATFCNYCGSKATDGSSSPDAPLGKATIQLSEHRDVTNPSLPPVSNMLPTSSGVTWTSQPYTSASSPYQPYAPASPTPQPYTSASSPYQPYASVPPQPQVLPPPNAMQRTLIGIFQPALASNPWLGIILGSIVALIGTTLLSALVLAIVHGILPTNAHDVASLGYSAEDRGDYILGVSPVHVFLRDSLQLLFVMHGVGIHLQYTSTSNSPELYTYSSYAPLNGLLFLPALLLAFGGYLAACTDFQNRFFTSLLRGAAIAIPYTLLLLILTSQVNGPMLGVNGTVLPYNATLSVDTLMVLLFGLFWGVLFGALGASLKFAQGQWRHMLYTFLRTNASPQRSGVIVGGLVAIGLGLALTLLTLWSFVAYTFYSSPLLASTTCISTDWQSLTLWSIAQGPIHAVDAFAFSLGVPITFVNQLRGQQCFYTSAPRASLSLFDSVLHNHPWVYALLLIPAFSLFVGGRASVATSRVRGIGPSAIQGALIALPFTVCMIILVLLSTITNVSTTINGATNNSTMTQSASVDVLNMLLWALLSGAFFGLLGGMYQASPVKNGVKSLLMALGLPFSIILKPFYALLDSVSGQSRVIPRSSARTLLYNAFLVSVLLVIAAGVVGVVLINANQQLTFENNQRLLDILSVLLIALPGIVLLCSIATAFATEPPKPQPNTMSSLPTSVQMQRGF